ncbi:MAG: inositol monophosphatase family protein [Acidimicrobiales bacterium]
MTGPGDRPSSTELLDLATGLAEKAGSTITEMRAGAVSSATTKSSPTDPVTAADREAEEMIVAGILEARPDDGIVGEEGTDRTGRTGVVWHIDPIDGTTNYLYDIPAYSVSIAAQVEGAVVAGVVLNPAADELYAARAGRGATRNGLPIAASTTDQLASCLVATGFGYIAERRRVQAEVIAALLPEVRDLRRFGSAALDLCAVACGRVDAYFEAGLNSWDFAAGWLIASEAGAVCDDLRDGDPSERFLMAAAPGVHRSLTTALQRLDADRVIA